MLQQNSSDAGANGMNPSPGMNVNDSHTTVEIPPSSGLTDYHAKYYANELTKRYSSDNLEKLAGTVAGAQVDLNPHQVDAALFAFNSPLSRGALLADEVGLCKTIEAGIVLSQRWAERKRRILVITPSNLRKQWYQEWFLDVSRGHFHRVATRNNSVIDYNQTIVNHITVIGLRHYILFSASAGTNDGVHFSYAMTHLLTLTRGATGDAYVCSSETRIRWASGTNAPRRYDAKRRPTRV